MRLLRPLLLQTLCSLVWLLSLSCCLAFHYSFSSFFDTDSFWQTFFLSNLKSRISDRLQPISAAPFTPKARLITLLLQQAPGVKAASGLDFVQKRTGKWWDGRQDVTNKEPLSLENQPTSHTQLWHVGRAKLASLSYCVKFHSAQQTPILTRQTTGKDLPVLVIPIIWTTCTTLLLTSKKEQTDKWDGWQVLWFPLSLLPSLKSWLETKPSHKGGDASLCKLLHRIRKLRTLFNKSTH